MSFVRLLSVLTLLLAANELSATNAVVGKCKPTLPQYPTITAAINSNAVQIFVCPGTYHEQLVIHRPLELEGSSINDQGLTIIAPPNGGLMVNATNDLGDPIAAQILVSVPSELAPVNITGLVIDGTGHGITSAPPYVVGIFYQNTSGIVNRVTTRYQTGNGGGVGFWLEGGSANPSVVVENSNTHDFDYAGVWAEAETATTVSQITATIKNNDINANVLNAPAHAGIVMGAGSTTTVSNNYVLGGAFGLFADGSSLGTASGNTLMGNGTGVQVNGGASIINNRILDSCPNRVGNVCAGIVVNSALPAVQKNVITNCLVGIEFNGKADGNVSSNTITDGTIGVNDVPVGLPAANSFFNVRTLRTGPSGSPAP
jgi:hypothetical protein